METRRIKVLIGGQDKSTRSIGDFLAQKGMSVSYTEKNPIHIQYQAIEFNCKVVVISDSTRYCVSLCECLKRSELSPIIILLHQEDEPMDYLSQNRLIDYEISDFEDLNIMYENIIRLLQSPNYMGTVSISKGCTANAPVFNLHSEISKILSRLCITPNYNGYGYIREAIKLAVKEDGLLTGISKQLYPEIAQRLNVTVSSVERNIRTAIQRSWDKAPACDKLDIFGGFALAKSWVPTNSEYIYIIADKLCCQMKSDPRIMIDDICNVAD